MNKLIKQSDICPTLSRDERITVSASGSKMIIEMNEDIFFDQLINAINQALVITGQKKLNDTDIAMMSKLVGDELLNKYPKYKIEEIFHAVKNGAFGEYDQDVIYVSPKNVLRWCVKYQAKKYETLMKQQKHEEKLRDKSKQDRHNDLNQKYFMMLHEKVYQDFDSVHNGRALSSAAEVYFNSLQRIGVIEISKKEKQNKFRDIRFKIIAAARLKAEKFIDTDIDHQTSTACREFFYEKFLMSVMDWEILEGLIKEKTKEYLF